MLGFKHQKLVVPRCHELGHSTYPVRHVCMRGTGRHVCTCTCRIVRLCVGIVVYGSVRSYVSAETVCQPESMVSSPQVALERPSHGAASEEKRYPDSCQGQSPAIGHDARVSDTEMIEAIEISISNGAKAQNPQNGN